jgi:hypothetical protein
MAAGAYGLGATMIRISPSGILSSAMQVSALSPPTPPQIKAACSAANGFLKSTQSSGGLANIVTPPCTPPPAAMAAGKCALSPVGCSTGPYLTISHLAPFNEAIIVNANHRQSAPSLEYKISALPGGPISIYFLNSLASICRGSAFRLICSDISLAMRSMWLDSIFAIISSETSCWRSAISPDKWAKWSSPNTPITIATLQRISSAVSSRVFSAEYARSTTISAPSPKTIIHAARRTPFPTFSAIFLSVPGFLTRAMGREKYRRLQRTKRWFKYAMILFAIFAIALAICW